MIKLISGALLLAATPAAAGVVGSSAHGFEVRQSIDLPIPPARALAAFGQVQRWWSKDHTYSGDSARLSLVLQPGGCFCERLDGGGGIEHLRVTYVQPGKRVVLTGGLGPLLFEATAGVMDVEVKPNPGGSTLTITYRAAGFARGNGSEMAVAVNQVLGQQAARLKAFASRPAAKN